MARSTKAAGQEQAHGERLVAPRAGPGRPPAEIDPDQVYKLAGLGHTMPEIAAWFGVTERTLRKRKKGGASEIADAYRRGKAEFRGGLRSMQLKRARLEAAGVGSGATLIWLGKCELGQRERVDVGLDGAVKTTTTHRGRVRVDHGVEELGEVIGVLAAAGALSGSDAAAGLGGVGREGAGRTPPPCAS